MLYIKQQKIYFIFISILIIFIDQLTKSLINSNYESYINSDFIFFSIKYIKNYGAAFNILTGSRILLSIISVIFSIYIVYLIFSSKKKTDFELYGYSFILGGSLGNGIDRIINGYVIDFINLNFLNFPVFNIADISINIGFIIFLYCLVKYKS